MTRRWLPPFCLLLALFPACDFGLFGPTTRIFLVNHHAAECVGVDFQTCLLVRERGDEDFGFLYQGIQGFTYTWGVNYFLEVEEHHVSNPPADGSSIRFELRRVISSVRVAPGTEFDLPLTGRADRLTQTGPGRYSILDGMEFVCAPTVSCPELLAAFSAGGIIRFRLAHPAIEGEPLLVVGWQVLLVSESPLRSAVHERRLQLERPGAVAFQGVRRGFLPDFDSVRIQPGPAHLDDGDPGSEPLEAPDFRPGIGNAPRVVLRLRAAEELLHFVEPGLAGTDRRNRHVTTWGYVHIL